MDCDWAGSLLVLQRIKSRYNAENGVCASFLRCKTTEDKVNSGIRWYRGVEIENKFRTSDIRS